MISQYPLVLILIPLGTAFLIPLVDLFRASWRKGLVIASTCLSFLIALGGLLRFMPSWLEGSFFLYTPLAGWRPPFGIVLAVDGFGLIFSLLVSLSSFLVVLYSIGSIGHHEGKYYVIFFLLQGACQGVVLTGDLFNLYVFIELTSITSYALVVFDRSKEAIEAGIKYLFYGILAGIFIFISIILTYRSLGTLNMAHISQNFHLIPASVRQVIVITGLVGLFIKLGVFPFHFWMAKVYGSAVTPVSAFLSGTVCKVNLYTFLRLFWTVYGIRNLDDFFLRPLMLILVLFSAFLGHLLAFGEKDFKRMLAFSSIAHIGFILTAFLLNSPVALYAGLLHTIIHSLMKTNLFFSAGYIVQSNGQTRPATLSGAMFIHRGVFLCLSVSSLAIIGIPPLNGFFGKWFLLRSYLDQGLHPGMLVLMAGSLMALVYYLRFLLPGLSREQVIHSTECPPDRETRMSIALTIVYIVTVLIVLNGFLYQYLDLPLGVAVADLGSPERYIFSVLGNGGISGE